MLPDHPLLKLDDLTNTGRATMRGLRAQTLGGNGRDYKRPAKWNEGPYREYGEKGGRGTKEGNTGGKKWKKKGGGTVSPKTSKTNAVYEQSPYAKTASRRCPGIGSREDGLPRQMSRRIGKRQDEENKKRKKGRRTRRERYPNKKETRSEEPWDPPRNARLGDAKGRRGSREKRRGGQKQQEDGDRN